MIPNEEAKTSDGASDVLFEHLYIDEKGVRQLFLQGGLVSQWIDYNQGRS